MKLNSRHAKWKNKLICRFPFRMYGISILLKLFVHGSWTHLCSVCIVSKKCPRNCMHFWEWTPIWASFLLAGLNCTIELNWPWYAILWCMTNSITMKLSLYCMNSSGIMDICNTYYIQCVLHPHLKFVYWILFPRVCWEWLYLWLHSQEREETVSSTGGLAMVETSGRRYSYAVNRCIIENDCIHTLFPYSCDVCLLTSSYNYNL